MAASVPEQGSKAWLALRAGKINASSCAVWELKSPWGKPKDQVRTEVRALAGAESEFFETPAVKQGREKEPEAIEFFEWHTGLQVDVTGSVEHPEYSFLRASPDGLVGLNACLEIKCPANGKTYSYKEKPVYEWQMRMQMEVLDVDLCYFVCYVNDDVFKIEEVKRRKGWLEEKVPGQLLPHPDDRMIRRIDLYHAWYNFIQSEFQDPERLKQYLDPKDTCEMIKDDDDLNALAQRFERKNRLEAEIDVLAGDQRVALEMVEKDIKALQGEVKKKYSSNVTNGSVEVHITVKAAQFDFQKAYDALGGDAALEEKGLDKSGFFKKQVKQAKIRNGGNNNGI